MKVMCIRKPLVGEFTINKIYENVGVSNAFNEYNQYLIYDDTNGLKVVDSELFITMDKLRDLKLESIDI